MYITTMANPHTNSTDHDVSSGANGNGGWHSCDANGIPYAHMSTPSTIRSIPDTAYGVVTLATLSLAVANPTMTNEPPVSAINYYVHMPYEITQSFGIQRELPKGFLVEATYSGNEGRKLAGPAYPSQFPKSLFVPGNAAIYGTLVETPFTGTGNTGAASLSK